MAQVSTTDQTEFDAVVVGSGAAGLTAALAAADHGCSVLVLEKSDLIGGTSAFSGGMLWVPNNHAAQAEGFEDSAEDALAYIRGLTQGREPDPELIDVYVQRSPDALAFLEATTPVKFHVTRAFSDYYASREGGRRCGRSVEPVPYAARDELGESFDRLRSSPHMPHLMLDEIAGEGAAADPKNANAVAAGAAAMASHLPKRMEERERDGIRCVGAALMSGLLRGALDLGIEVRTSTRVVELIVEDGSVVGVVADGPDGRRAIRARRGVVLASGGFEWNPQLVKAFIGIENLRPISPPTNEGDGLVMGLEAGAAVANMTSTWAIPVLGDLPFEFEGKQMAIQDTPRMEAGVILINRHGQRFTNEAVCYMDMPRSHRIYDPLTQTWPNTGPVWAVFDQRVRDRIAIRDLLPGEATPEWVLEAATLDELAAKMDVPAAAFADQVARFNTNARQHVDPEFGRGTVWYEGLTSGGPHPERALAPVDAPPYYAMRIYEGTIGTNGGLLTDGDGRVRAMRGGFITGLYAAGNAAASACGPAYPGGGITLGEAVTFGYLSGRHLARVEEETGSDSAATAGSGVTHAVSS
jgi:3-oxosteroid 1-dehydrogenase